MRAKVLTHSVRSKIAAGNRASQDPPRTHQTFSPVPRVLTKSPACTNPRFPGREATGPTGNHKLFESTVKYRV